MQYSFLFRECLSIDDDGFDFDSCKSICELENINFVKYRSKIQENSCVIGRYSVLPYYQELEEELKTKNSYLINSHKSHLYIADMEYMNDIADYTPETWFIGDSSFRISNLDENSAYVLKGKTNSRKHNWNTHMFAKNRDDIPRVFGNLMNDSLVKDQGVVIRKYYELEKIEDGINGLPITNEWRFFCFKDKIVSYGFYWTIIEEEKFPQIEQSAIDLVNIIIKIVKNNVNFYVIDVAKTNNGDWIVVEMNDAQMSGLSGNNPDTLYRNIIDEIRKEEIFR
jgi:hypothetical protein